jgi:hypothetical protein
MLPVPPKSLLLRLAAILCLIAASSPCQTGLFEEHADIGTVLHPGAVSFDASNHTYSITASGENMWATADAFHFLWKKFSGDVSLTADIAFPTKTGNPHKKAVLMIRQSLDADSPYLDAALHVEGLTSLQSRGEKGGATHEVGIASAAATRLRLEKRGANFYMYIARDGEDLHLGGGSLRLELQEPFYIGLGVCAHDKDAVETAVFSNVSIDSPSQRKPKLYSTLETISVSSTDRRVVAVFDKRVDAPNWTPDGTSLLFKMGRKIKRIPAAGGAVETAAGERSQKMDSERPSPNGKRVAFHSSGLLGVKDLDGGNTKVLAKISADEGALGTSPWSPDGKRLAFVSYQLVP